MAKSSVKLMTIEKKQQMDLFGGIVTANIAALSLSIRIRHERY